MNNKRRANTLKQVHQPKYRDFSDWKRRAPKSLYDQAITGMETLTNAAYMAEGDNYPEVSEHWLDLLEIHQRLNDCLPHELWPYIRNAVVHARRSDELQEVRKRIGTLLPPTSELLAPSLALADESLNHGWLPAMEACLETWAYNMDLMNRAEIKSLKPAYKRRVTRLDTYLGNDGTLAVEKTCRLRNLPMVTFEAALATPEVIRSLVDDAYSKTRRRAKAIQAVLVLERCENLSKIAEMAILDYCQGKLAPNRADKDFPQRPWIEWVLVKTKNSTV